MSSRRTKMMVGIFVFVGIAIGVAATIWLGASQYFKKGKLYAAYFGESVEVIGPGSRVKYMGLDIGSVQRIEVAPNKALMEVVIKTAREDLIDPRTVAEVKTSGFTGVGFVELHQVPPEQPPPSTKLPFTSEYPVIATAPSPGMGSLLAKAGVVVEQLKEVDFKGISDELKSTVKSANALVSDPKLARAVSNIESMSARLNRASRSLDTLVGSEDFRSIPADSRKTIEEARELLSQTREEIKKMRLMEIAGNVNALVDKTDDRTRVVAEQLSGLIRKINDDADSLQMLIDRLNNNPSELLFGKPPERGK
jgi:phospholipid/cholesterol/gamma-HCH transport system substrate-binding protein